MMWLFISGMLAATGIAILGLSPFQAEEKLEHGCIMVVIGLCLLAASWAVAGL